MYNYLDAMMDDVREAIKNDYDLNDWCGDRDGLEEKLNDELWIDDSVTGNGSGSYTFNREQAREYVQDDGRDYIEDMCADFGISADEIGRRFLDDDWEWFDVSIRCYLLGQAISGVLDELENEGAFDELEEEPEELEEEKKGA